jgi:SAM-dependent methyltransferase
MSKTFLHGGCGSSRKDRTTATFAGPDWQELRLDINAGVQPDIVGTMTDMAAVETGSVDAIYSAHNIEHLYPHEVPLAMSEFIRVLKPDGFAVITCPDLQSVAALIADDKLTDAAYVSPSGPIAPLDILYGHRPSLARGNLYMAHHCGFTKKVLGATLLQSGFHHAVTLQRSAPLFDLWAVATKGPMEETDLRELARQHFPA